MANTCPENLAKGQSVIKKSPEKSSFAEIKSVIATYNNPFNIYGINGQFLKSTCYHKSDRTVENHLNLECFPVIFEENNVSQSEAAKGKDLRHRKIMTFINQTSFSTEIKISSCLIKKDF